MIIGHATRGRLRLPCHILPLSAALARSISCSANGLAAKPDCCGDIPVDVLPPAPGTVAPYAHHIFIRTPPEATDGQQLGAWWPPVVERLPPFREAFSAIAAIKKNLDGVVKVTAFEFPNPEKAPPLMPGKCDMMLMSADSPGMWFEGLPQDKVGRVLQTLLPEPTDAEPGFRAPQLDKKLERLVHPTPPLTLFVCCHGSRDARCGMIGPRLVQRLEELVKERGWQEAISVFRCSHVGGHKYSGNVLVYSAVSPCDGDWYGGISALNAESFLDALADADVSASGGVSEAGLRQFWRGRIGLSKEEQLQAFREQTLGADDRLEDEDMPDDEEEPALDAIACELGSDHTDEESVSESSSSGDSSTSGSDSDSSDDDEPDSIPPLGPLPGS